MTGFAATIAQDLADAFRDGTAYTPPNPTHIRLHDGDPGPAGTANVISGYGYLPVTWSATADGRFTNTAALSWGALPVPVDHDSAYYTLWDGDGGSFILSDQATLNADIGIGQAVVIRAGGLVFGFAVAT